MKSLERFLEPGVQMTPDNMKVLTKDDLKFIEGYILGGKRPYQKAFRAAYGDAKMPSNMYKFLAERALAVLYFKLNGLQPLDGKVVTGKENN